MKVLLTKAQALALLTPLKVGWENAKVEYDKATNLKIYAVMDVMLARMEGIDELRQGLKTLLAKYEDS